MEASVCQRKTYVKYCKLLLCTFSGFSENKKSLFNNISELRNKEGGNLRENGEKNRNLG